MKFTTEIRDQIAIITSHVEKLDALHAPELKGELVRVSKEGTKYMVLTCPNLVTATVLD